MSNFDPSLHDQLQGQLDLYFNSLELEWFSSMTFPMHVGDDCAFNTSVVNVDICAFIGWLPEADHIPGEYAYFCRTKYPPCQNPAASLDESESFTLLRTDLYQSSVDAGFSLTSNGNTHNASLSKRKTFPKDSQAPFASRTFLCDRYRRYHQKRKRCTSTEDMQHRNTSLHNDHRGNSRGLDGKRGPRKCVTNRPLCNKDTCSFRFNVFVDLHGFYVKRNAGTTKHCNHMKRSPQDIPIKLRMLTIEQKKRAAELGKANTRPAAGRNFFHANHNMTLTPQQIRYAFHSLESNSKYHYDGIEIRAGAVVDWLRSTPGISFCIWGARPQKLLHAQVEKEAGLVFSENQMEDGTRNVTDLSDFCKEVVHEYSADMEALSLQEDQNFFIACAWISNKEKRMSRLLPYVLKVDVTEGTNKESRPLLTASIRTGFGKYIIILRMFLRDQRQATFRWVFSWAIQKLLGEEWVGHIKAIITDGDSHEITEVEEACKQFIPDCFRIRCGWHIIHKGWTRHCAFANAIPSQKTREYKLFCYTVKQWCYTMMYPKFCETREELHISKCLLLAYVHSRSV